MPKLNDFNTVLVRYEIVVIHLFAVEFKLPAKKLKKSTLQFKCLLKMITPNTYNKTLLYWLLTNMHTLIFQCRLIEPPSVVKRTRTQLRCHRLHKQRSCRHLKEWSPMLSDRETPQHARNCAALACKEAFHACLVRRQRVLYWIQHWTVQSVRSNS